MSTTVACVLALVSFVSACTEEPVAREEPAVGLRERLESTLAERDEELRADPTHAGLVRNVEQTDLLAALAHVGVHGDGADAFVLGSATQAEPHGGGLLDLILRQWRPQGRPAALDDHFPFAFGPRPSLGAIERGHRRQLWLPDDPAAFPRMRFAFGGREVETDAYATLRVLLAHEPDLDASWTDRAGRTLTTRRLLGRVWSVYSSPDALPADHTALHAVELLVPFAERSDGLVTREAIAARLLERLDAPPDGGTEVLAHQVEALGLLTAGAPAPWTRSQREQIHAWLDALATGPFAELDGVPLPHLCHLLRGLRLLLP